MAYGHGGLHREPQAPQISAQSRCQWRLSSTQPALCHPPLVGGASTLPNKSLKHLKSTKFISTGRSLQREAQKTNLKQLNQK